MECEVEVDGVAYGGVGVGAADAEFGCQVGLPFDGQADAAVVVESVVAEDEFEVCLVCAACAALVA